MFPVKRIVPSTDGIDVNRYYTSEDKLCDGLLIGNYGERKETKYLIEVWDIVSRNVKGQGYVL